MGAFILSILFNFAWGVTMPLPWAMMADVADYSEWKNNRRATGITFAAIVVGLKGWNGNRRRTSQAGCLRFTVMCQMLNRHLPL